MDSIGEKLRSAREAKRLTIKDIVKETNITPLYLEALEDEEFDKFPSETYLIGYLRSYSEFLKLDADEIIQSYKGYKIGESATPLEELTKPTRPSISMVLSSFVNRYRNLVYITGVVVGALILFWLFRAIFVRDVDISEIESIDHIKNEYKAENKGAEFENLRNLQLSNDSGVVLVFRNEAVQFLVENKEIAFLLKDIKANNVIIELLPGRKPEVIEMEKPREIKIPDCPRQVIFTLKGLTENRAKIMVMLGDAVETALPAKVAQGPAEVKTDNTGVIAQNKKNLRIVFEANFVQKSFIELYLDGTQKYRGFVQEGSQERWEAVEYIQIKIGNAGGMKSRINGKDYVFGAAGQVANKTITWKKDVSNPNLYHIIVKDW